MFDTWLKMWENLFSYKNFKSEVQKWNQKTVQFWQDAIEDITSSKEKEND